MTERYIGWSREPMDSPPQLQNAAIEFNMISGWTPINHPVVNSRNQTQASAMETPEDGANAIVPTKRKRGSKTSTEALDKTTQKKPRKTTAKADQGPPTKRKKTPKQSGNAMTHHSDSSELLSADAMYGLDEPFPDILLTSDFSLPLRNLKDDQDELPSAASFSGQVEAPSAGQFTETSHSSADKNRGWSDSTVAINSGNQSMYNMFFSSDLPSDLEDQGLHDDYDDLDDIDIAYLEQLESEGAILRSSSPLNDHGSQAMSGMVVPEATGMNSSSESDSRLFKLTSRPDIPPSDPKSSISKPFKTPFERKPIVRPPFPQPTRDRSPVTGISPSTVLRTCFRIGEAINAGSRAVRENKDVIIELFARVKSSNRESGGVKQNFQLMDLHHDRPPHLPAVYDLWKDSLVWERESGLFLEQLEPKMCRCVGRMKKDDQQKLIFILLNIWEASWKNVEHTKGIICGMPM